MSITVNCSKLSFALTDTEDCHKVVLVDAYANIIPISIACFLCLCALIWAFLGIRIPRFVAFSVSSTSFSLLVAVILLLSLENFEAYKSWIISIAVGIVLAIIPTVCLSLSKFVVGYFSGIVVAVYALMIVWTFIALENFWITYVCCNVLALICGVVCFLYPKYFYVVFLCNFSGFICSLTLDVFIGGLRFADFFAKVMVSCSSFEGEVNPIARTVSKPCWWSFLPLTIQAVLIVIGTLVQIMTRDYDAYIEGISRPCLKDYGKSSPRKKSRSTLV